MTESKPGTAQVSWSKASAPRLVAFTAVMGAIGYLGFFVAIPLAPSVVMTFGDFPYVLTAITIGPGWGILAAGIAGIAGIIVFGTFFPGWFGGLMFAIFAGLLSWKGRGLRPILATTIGYVLIIPYWFWSFPLIGFPFELTVLAVVKGFISTVIQGIVIEILLGIPAFVRLVPGWAKPHYGIILSRPRIPTAPPPPTA